MQMNKGPYMKANALLEGNIECFVSVLEVLLGVQGIECTLSENDLDTGVPGWCAPFPRVDCSAICTLQ